MQRESAKSAADRHEGLSAVSASDPRTRGPIAVNTMGRAAESRGVSVDSLRDRAEAGRVETVHMIDTQRLIDGVALA